MHLGSSIIYSLYWLLLLMKHNLFRIQLELRKVSFVLSALIFLGFQKEAGEFVNFNVSVKKNTKGILFLSSLWYILGSPQYLFFPFHNYYIFILFLRDKNEKTEFDFDKDKYDIRIPEDLDETGKRGYKKQERLDQIVPESDYSLRVCMLFSFICFVESERCALLF